MPKKAKELSATEVRRLSHAVSRDGRPYNAVHAVGGVAGLLLQVTPTGAKNWVLRTTVGSKRRDIGLGGFPDVPLAMAREKAREAKEQIKQGIDPVEQRKAARASLIAAQAKNRTFDDCAAQYMKDKLAGRSAKNQQAWAGTLERYASPAFGSLAVADVELAHVLKALEPIWKEKTETAQKLRQRIEKVLDWAKVRGYREGDNPARWEGHLKEVLQAPSEIRDVQHHPALPWQEVGEFMQKLRLRDGIAARCLEFVILTGLRSAEVRGARWEEIDFKAKTWTVPAKRMKMKQTHVVPLCADAITLLEQMPRLGDLIFPGARGGVLSDVGLTKPIESLHAANIKQGGKGFIDPKEDNRRVTVHGFRSTLRDWMSENTSYPHEVQKMALAHAIDDAVERAYRRGDLLEKRTNLMRDWCKYINSPAKAGEVVGIREGKA